MPATFDAIQIMPNQSNAVSAHVLQCGCDANLAINHQLYASLLSDQRHRKRGRSTLYVDAGAKRGDLHHAGGRIFCTARNKLNSRSLWQLSSDCESPGRCKCLWRVNSGSCRVLPPGRHSRDGLLGAHHGARRHKPVHVCGNNRSSADWPGNEQFRDHYRHAHSRRIV